VGRQSQTITGATKRLGHRGDETDLTSTIEESEPFGRGRTGLADRFERPHRVYSFEDLVARDQPVSVPLALGVERHEFDEPHDSPGLTGKVCKVEHFVVVRV